ncbi:MAG: SWIM zinc finger family protein [Clostridia bacterium]
MSILNCASSASVYRGYDYYINKHITSIIKINSNEYEGYVNGNTKDAYYVKINIEHPRKSYCDCPFATGNTVCKHMVALYFSAFPQEADDYNDWMSSKYSDEDYEEDYDDEYEDYYYDDYRDQYDEDYIKPLFFDEMLKTYINNLSVEEQKQILYEELKQNEKRTLDKYLKATYEKYIKDNKSLNSFIELLYKNTQELIKNYDFNYKDYNVIILSNKNKSKLNEIYDGDKYLIEKLDKVLLDPKLTVYYDYKWIAEFYKDKLSKEELKSFNNEIDEFFNYLKHYSIRNSVPKSNILIVKYILNEYSLKEIAKSLLKNAKYPEYIQYVMDNVRNTKELYKCFLDEIKENYINRNHIPSLLLNFELKLDDEDVFIEYCYYNFIINGNDRALDYLAENENFDEYYKRIITSTKNVVILEKLYKNLGKIDELFTLLYNKENEYRLIENIEVLKEKYNGELYKYFRERFYEKLKEGKQRKIYEDASRYIRAIYKLNQGEMFINKIIKELQESEYTKRSALFEEVYKAINN